MNCCKKDDKILPASGDPPNLLKNLLTDDHPEACTFFKAIRQLNSALAFTSIKYTPDYRLGVHAYNASFQIQDELSFARSSRSSNRW
jgi:hypothetical protein